MMHRWDPRALAHRQPRLTALVFTVVTALMVMGNVVTIKGGILDDPITDSTNGPRRSDEYVRGLGGDGFDSGEAVPFLLRFPCGIQTPSDVARIREFTDRLEAEFGPGVLSLATIPDYRDTGEELLNDPYVPVVVGEDFDVSAWRQRVSADPGVFGTFVGRDFEWATVVRYLPPGYDDIVEFRRTAEFLEERTIPWWEWLYKTDIEAPENVGVGDWVVGRGLLDQALTIDNLTLVGVGIALTLPLLAWVLRSTREALLGVGVVIVLGFVWCRGSIGLLDLLGFPVRERVYVLLAYTNCIVQGVSFVLHKFEAFHEVSARTGAPSGTSERWSLAVGNDHLIGATALISVLGFATLASFQVVTIRELGVLSALAVIYQVALALLLLPALHSLVGESARSPASTTPRGERMVGSVLDWLVRRAISVVLRYSPRRTARFAGAVTAGVVALAIVLVWPLHGLLVKTFPLEFISGTVVERTAQFLNEPGRLGFAMRALLVQPTRPEADIHDPDFLASVHAFQEKLAEDPLVRETTSVVDQVSRVALESFGVALPRTREQARAAFGIVEGGLDRGVARQFFFTHGIRIIATFEGDDSTRFSVIGRNAETLAREFPDLRVIPFGKSALYGEVDHYVSVGKPWNVLWSQVVVVILCCVGVWINSRRLGMAKGRAMSPLRGGLVMSVPFVFASTLMVFLMVGFRIPLDAATAAITALAINASVDFSIYMADAYQEGDATTGKHDLAVFFALASKGRVVLADMVLNAVCFLPLTFSRFQPVHELGWIMMVMLLACGFGTVVLMPALLVWAVPRGREQEVEDVREVARRRLEVVR
jgi:hypothetical protein